MQCPQVEYQVLNLGTRSLNSTVIFVQLQTDSFGSDLSGTDFGGYSAEMVQKMVHFRLSLSSATTTTAK